MFSLSELQRYNAHDRQHDAYDPESGCDLGFVIAQFLIMMVEGGHPEDAPPLSVFLSGVFEV